MPRCKVEFLQSDSGAIPALDWLRALPKGPQAKGWAMITLLAENGQALRRPHADYLRDGIYELRWRWQRVNYRFLYFFRGSGIIIVSHGITKIGRVPNHDIDLTIKLKRQLEGS